MLSSSLVCTSATLREKNFRTDLHEIFTEGWQWVTECLHFHADLKPIRQVAQPIS